MLKTILADYKIVNREFSYQNFIIVFCFNQNSRYETTHAIFFKNVPLSEEKLFLVKLLIFAARARENLFF